MSRRSNVLTLIQKQGACLGFTPVQGADCGLGSHLHRHLPCHDDPQPQSTTQEADRGVPAFFISFFSTRAGRQAGTSVVPEVLASSSAAPRTDRNWCPASGDKKRHPVTTRTPDVCVVLVPHALVILTYTSVRRSSSSQMLLHSLMVDSC
ncbi:hypothetical protein NDU88_003571 [Pleurodeles waltl]|uniref:Uncharacterized protein n=1 Tax=Pleurodeles waltl TaxID=8319 RepID=A0AAV7WT64_PLEWA|nr:hypothetical protein NDU88_003571 [Pleurodeles waltl]